MNRTLKLAATSLIVLLGTTVGAFAATYGWIEKDTKVKEGPAKWYDTLAWADEGDKVKILDHEDGYYLVKHGGDYYGWVRDHHVDFGYDEDHHDVSFCIGGFGPGPFGGFGGGELCVN